MAHNPPYMRPSYLVGCHEECRLNCSYNPWIYIEEHRVYFSEPHGRLFSADPTDITVLGHDEEWNYLVRVKLVRCDTLRAVYVPSIGTRPVTLLLCKAIEVFDKTTLKQTPWEKRLEVVAWYNEYRLRLRCMPH